MSTYFRLAAAAALIAASNKITVEDGMEVLAMAKENEEKKFVLDLSIPKDLGGYIFPKGRVKNKYQPHQGKKEMARRAKQMAKGRLP